MSYNFVHTCSGGENGQSLKKIIQHYMKIVSGIIKNTFAFLLCLTGLILMANGSEAQIHQPIKWHFMVTPKPDQEAVLTITASLEEGWHVYSQFIEEGGPLSTTFKFHPSEDYVLIDKVKEESKPIESYDRTFDMNITWFENTAIFTQRIKVKGTTATVAGEIEYMVCNESLCLPPDVKEFSLNVKVEKSDTKKSSLNMQQDEGRKTKKVNQDKALEKWSSTERKEDKFQILASETKEDDSGYAQASDSDSVEVKAVASASTSGSSFQETPAQNQKSGQFGDSLWNIFIAGFLGGLAAIIMPCIFPMIPFTVGYFTKRSVSQARSIGLALFYGFSIIILYVAVGLMITVIFGSDALNDLSTNGAFNFFFFLLLLVFAASFLGAFEITLPASWVNRMDAKADRGGVLGIFFMAATLALVSFSCTGPIIGTLLVEAATQGKLLGPAIGMLGFGAALALPFMVFSMFPSLIGALPKSGGWLNSVKVVLGFLELALALKFLSNVDLAYHWQWFDREVFLALWIIIFGLMGLYLLGKIKLPHDAASTHLSPLRLSIAIVTLAFTLYMIPGLWGAPLKVIAAFLPPQQTQDFDLYSNMNTTSRFVNNTVKKTAKKYEDIFDAPYDLDAFFDYEEGIAYARKVNKPIMVDFTGHACVNCRKMEAVIWPDAQVLKRLREDYVLIQLYVDDKTTLPEPEQKISTHSGKKIKTLGNKWSDLQASAYHSNSQPYYVLLDHRGELLVPAKGADYDVDNFRLFLDEGLSMFKNKWN